MLRWDLSVRWSLIQDLVSAVLFKMNMENLKDYKEKPNKELLEKLFKLKNEFDKTKSLIVNLTYHLDKVEKAYNQINDEMKKRLGDDK